MPHSNRYRFEKFEEYYGDLWQVKKIIDECKVCGAKLVHSHDSDHTNLLMRESSECPECGCDQRQVIHIIN